MPSLQQFNATDCGLTTAISAAPGTLTNTAMATATASLTANMRALAGADILQKHSINSILERRQEFLGRRNDVINDTLISTINDPIAVTDFLGLGKSHNSILLGNAATMPSTTTTNISATTMSINGHGETLTPAMSAYTPLTPTNSTQCSISPGTLSANSYDVFQFENIAQNQNPPQIPPLPTQQPLKVGFQRNISFDCSAPLSPSTPTSLYNRSFSSPLVSDSSNSSSANGLSLDSIPLVYQNHYNVGINNGLGGGMFSSSRSNSPESENSNQSSSETQNLIDMMNILSVNSDTQAQQQQQLQMQQQQNHIYAQQQQQEQQQQQLLYNNQHLQMPTLKVPYWPTINFPNQNAITPTSPAATQTPVSAAAAATTTTTPTYTNLFDEQNLQNFEALSAVDFELTKLQNFQALNTQIKLLQAQSQQMPLLNQLLQGYNQVNQLKNWQPCVAALNDVHLDRVAKFYRSSAALCEATCTWSGQLPPRSHRLHNYSPKVFLGGIPWDISEQSLIQIFKPFGQIKVEWPGKEQQAAQPKGYAYIIFESDKQVKALLSACVLQVDDSHSGCIYYYKISSRRIKAKDVEVIPWFIADSNYVNSTSQKLDPTKTVFVGALHGKLTAEGLAKIMDDLFDGVLYAGIDTDKYKYPIGSGRVTFNNNRSYMKAVTAAFIEIRTSKFTKKLQVDPYLEDSLCSICGVQHGPYYCRELSCFRYFCRSCWQWQHTTETVKHHKPLTRNSKSQTLVGIGPASSTSSLNSAANITGVQAPPQQQHQLQLHKKSFLTRQQQQQQQHQNEYELQQEQQQQQYQHQQQQQQQAQDAQLYSLEAWLEIRQKQQQLQQQQQQQQAIVDEVYY